jgi:UDP-N-acetyl-D-mannosaminuronic acid dehydrogenase
VHDPIVSRFSEPLLSMDDSLNGSDCIVLVADHREVVKPEICGKPMRQKNIVDARNMLD